MNEDQRAAKRSNPFERKPITTLWSEGDLRCVLSWDGRRYQIDLHQGDWVLRSQTAEDDAALVAIARRWRREYATRS